MNIDKFRDSFNPDAQRVLLMLSGGKDSSACLILLSEMGVELTAIHFTHKWASQVSTNEARRLCGGLQVELIEVDFTEDFYDSIQGFEGGRPCLICKPQMYKHVNKELQSGRYDWICIGDNANDTTTIARLKEYIRDKPDESIYCNTYFGSEQGCVLSDGIKVLRPILDIDAEGVESFVESRGVIINKNHSTGDKYFEYVREGCPVQFHDPGYPIDSVTLDALSKYNTSLGEFAKKKNIRASVHLPSTFIVTIPEGFEVEAADHLEHEGLLIDRDINGLSESAPAASHISINLTNTQIYVTSTYKRLYERFIERMQYTVVCHDGSDNQHVLTDVYDCTEGQIYFTFIKNKSVLMIDLCTEQRPLAALVKNLIVEIFRTRRFKVVI